jgi:hypothetical protein
MTKSIIEMLGIDEATLRETGKLVVDNLERGSVFDGPALIIEVIEKEKWPVNRTILAGVMLEKALRLIRE